MVKIGVFNGILKELLCELWEYKMVCKYILWKWCFEPKDIQCRYAKKCPARQLWLSFRLLELVLKNVIVWNCGKRCKKQHFSFNIRIQSIFERKKKYKSICEWHNTIDNSPKYTNLIHKWDNVSIITIKHQN